jgi:hypothetical protein
MTLITGDKNGEGEVTGANISGGGGSEPAPRCGRRTT